MTPEEKIAAHPYPLPAVHPRPDEESDGLWYTYRCDGCAGIVTKVQILRHRAEGVPSLCDCGGRRVKPCNPTPRDEAAQLDDLLELARAISEGTVTPHPPSISEEEVNAALSDAGSRALEAGEEADDSVERG
jgi:hypothetical protein